jgi:coenzyme F420-reducing hydrogenase delta subunit
MQQRNSSGEHPHQRVFTPRLLLFQCRFNHYSRVDLMALESLETAQVKCIQVPCAGRISPFFILNAVQAGIDGIVVSGCRPGQCHYRQGNLGARRHLAAFRHLLIYLGMDPQRIRFIWLDPAERGRLMQELAQLIGRVQVLGPNRHLVTRSVAAADMETEANE